MFSGSFRILPPIIVISEREWMFNNHTVTFEDNPSTQLAMGSERVGEMKQTKMTALKSTANNIRRSTKQLYKIVKTKIRPASKEKDTIVEEIHITQESDVDAWAERSIGRRASRPISGNDDTSYCSTDDVNRISSATSSSSQRSAASTSCDVIETVHDMAMGYPQCEDMFS